MKKKKNASRKIETKILKFIRQYKEKNGYAPSYREIGAAVGLRSSASISWHLNRMKEEGLLSFAEGGARTITITEDGREESEQIEEAAAIPQPREVLYHADIELSPITKKNSQQIAQNRKTGKSFIVQSSQYKRYAKNAGYFLVHPPEINEPVNVQMLFYMDSNRKVDLSNLQSAALDVLVDNRVLADDRADIVVSHDGSRVIYPDPKAKSGKTIQGHTEIIITKATDTRTIPE